jgi:hypothetical protein
VREEWSGSGRGREGESLHGISAPLMWMCQLAKEVCLAPLGSPPKCHVTQLRRPRLEEFANSLRDSRHEENMSPTCLLKFSTLINLSFLPF